MTSASADAELHVDPMYSLTTNAYNKETCRVSLWSTSLHQLTGRGEAVEVHGVA
jgi:hypothetical protein